MGLEYGVPKPTWILVKSPSFSTSPSPLRPVNRLSSDNSQASSPCLSGSRQVSHSPGLDLARTIHSTNSKRFAWQNFPGLKVLNQPNSARRNATQIGFNETSGFGASAPSSYPATGESCIGHNVTGFDCSASISQNRSIPLSYPGREVFLEWENPGKPVGRNNSYVTLTSAQAPQFVLWVSQLNATYSPLTNITTRNGLNYGQTIQPDVSTYEGDPAINGKCFQMKLAWFGSNG
jgi:hypothetical protein